MTMRRTAVSSELLSLIRDAEKLAARQKREICRFCVGDDHYTNHSPIGCLNTVTEGYICGCTRPQTNWLTARRNGQI